MLSALALAGCAPSSAEGSGMRVSSTPDLVSTAVIEGARPEHLTRTAYAVLLACGRAERRLTDLAEEVRSDPADTLDGALGLGAHGLITLSRSRRRHAAVTPTGDRLRRDCITAIVATISIPYDIPPFALPDDPASPFTGLDRVLTATARNPPENP
ncbi:MULTISPECIES: hypothetical protein [Actinoalloteichus]|uniref:Uncharacterized protein n=1 Tax=Actinoalloteichus fjordicus TaxID=1612552 RepID=A0AAC9PTJ7_9PSEU|nr:MULTISPECIES: hypothetical protein [Actinoalloteichus]APU16208.1 hypothetical protein UA74_20915 [Actinoalloteichus fjordicus]APU22269.1 hypothetical protein UA75_21400 [Actinoalloteichus sp. GBA129-24]